MGKKIDAGISAMSVLGMLLIPVLRSGDLPQVWERIVQVELTGIGLREIFGFFVLGVQFLPAFWFACVAKHYVTNMLILAALTLFVIVARKTIQRKVVFSGRKKERT